MFKYALFISLEKMRGKILAGVFVLFLLSAGVHAEIILSQTKAVYNVGDSLDISAKVIAGESISGFFEMNLVCWNVSKMIYFSPLLLGAGQEEKVNQKL